MIGVLAPQSDRRVIAEFFELFKTPWEYFGSGRRYDVILCVGNVQFDQAQAKVIVHYADCMLPIDAQEGVEVALNRDRDLFVHQGRSLVVYGQHVKFRHKTRGTTDVKEVDEECSYRCLRDGITVHRIGYDLFAEIAALLMTGQPAEYANYPTLEIHIAALRDVIVESGVELIEIPPVPHGYGCVACLTHDIDHPAIKNHKWDATAFGFLYRAIVGTLVNFLRGGIPLGTAVKNFAAALKLPFVYAGIAKDFWSGFEDRYFEIEHGRHATYFVIPFERYSGKDGKGRAPKRRASGYAAREIKDALRRIKAEGCEVALHGIDAWCDLEAGCKEVNEVRELIDEAEIGVRMHWLFYDDKSPLVLEKAGASYDSTIGYRETIGFRSGTTQVYKPIEAERILELPMHVMDTSLFYRAYLGFSQQEAEVRVREMIAAVSEFGGCLTVNWHDRSLAPERNWNSCYRTLLKELTQRNAWFATAREATSWFRLRRSVVFGTGAVSSDGAHAAVTDALREQVPALTLRVHKLERGAEAGSTPVRRCVDLPVAAATQRLESAVAVS
jgi:hypothetical protein